MNAIQQLPEGVVSTLATFERMVKDDEQRCEVLQAELSALRLRERVIGATQDVGWLVTQYIQPRQAELATLETRLGILRKKIQEVRDRWTNVPVAATPPANPAIKWLDTGCSNVISLSM